MDLTLYQKMIGANDSITQAYINDSIMHVNDMFSKSPSFKLIKFDGVDIDCIVSHVKSNEMDLLLRPRTVIRNGIYASIDSDTYLVIDFIANEIYPKATITLCNTSLKWKNTLGEIKEYKCVVEGATYKEDKTKTIFTSNNELIAHVQYNTDTKTIKPSDRFIVGDSAYEIATIDSVTGVYGDKGVLKLGLKFSEKTDTDDIVNKVADASGNSGWGGW